MEGRTGREVVLQRVEGAGGQTEMVGSEGKEEEEEVVKVKVKDS